MNFGCYSNLSRVQMLTLKFFLSRMSISLLKKGLDLLEGGNSKGESQKTLSLWKVHMSNFIYV